MTALRMRMHRASFSRLRGAYWIASHGAAQRSFSSSSPEFERGLSGVMNVFNRVMDRSARFQRYQEQHVFPPDDSSITNMLAFVTLQIPQRTEIDAVEFLEGARHACCAHLEAIHSLQFGEYVGGGERSACTQADLLKLYCTPGFYKTAKANVKLTHAMRNLILELQGVAIESIHLKRAEYARLTAQEYEDEVNAEKNAPMLWSEDASMERLQLHVDVETVENVKMNYFKRNKTRFVQQQNAYRWIFESKVTRPEDVDWRIAAIYRVSGRVVDLPKADRKE
uniref:Uncharacterized protein n=1 Tax=Globisporangium ultimum (strain ATCC 200006 / CBS 805.95 / DAOM BR144) TaxID=431595 RepID=K3WT58_GLOUD